MTWLDRFKQRRAERREAVEFGKAAEDLLSACREAGDALGREYAAWALPQNPSPDAFTEGLKVALAQVDLIEKLAGMPGAFVDRAVIEMTTAAVSAAQSVMDSTPNS